MKEDNQNSCPRPMGMYENRHDGRLIPIPCNRWDCPHCGPIKKNRVADRVNRGFLPDCIAGNRIRALTLTQKLGTTQYIMDCWARFRWLLAKRGYHHLKYFWAKEFTKKGERHLHALINAYIPQEVLKECWSIATHGESYIVWITGKDLPDELGDIFNPAGYATKYLTKSYSDEVKFEKKERRFGFSRHRLFKPRNNFFFTALSVPDFWDIIVGQTPWKAIPEYHPGDFMTIADCINRKSSFENKEV